MTIKSKILTVRVEEEIGRIISAIALARGVTESELLRQLLTEAAGKARENPESLLDGLLESNAINLAAVKRTL